MLTLVLARPMGMMMGQLQHGGGAGVEGVIHETQNVKVVIFCHIRHAVIIPGYKASLTVSLPVFRFGKNAGKGHKKPASI